ncbi:interferon-inducible double-stranded RNA-dependent protein kinase activator A-like [Coccinella septempunctata]|uniref:interferon-inducible double-stranded RNA-dependent protein kinase activator A-like n=1 Tax=Coccinella septempunctata TaxID=41139 RepID=UPI001D06DD9A|nr:interferon-inducible double-stranded RNA-dependent protein kinase activator A-like [Coccinella septempunctata]
MTTGSKTPAMLLQEYTVKMKIGAPEYNLIVNKCGTHENEFQYQVNVGSVSATGKGRSKQVAKHSAAFRALELLNTLGECDIILTATPDFKPNLHRNEPDNPNEGSVNSIGCLQEICADNKIPLPVFHEISDVGPPHCRQFTYECSISSMRTQAIAKTKKQAKQLSAKLMLEKIKETIPDLVRENEDLSNTLMEDDDALKVYNRMSSYKVIKNKCTRIIDFPSCLVELMKNAELTKEDFEELLEICGEKTLKKILDKFELKHEFIVLQESSPAIVLLDVDLDTPFSVLGKGATEKEAKRDALRSIYFLLEAYINVADCDD